MKMFMLGLHVILLIFAVQIWYSVIYYSIAFIQILGKG